MSQSNPLHSKRVLIVLSGATPTLGDGTKSGWYWSEVYHPWEVFTKAGYTVEFISPTGSGSPDEHSIATKDQLMSFELTALKVWNDKSHPIHGSLAKLKSPSQIHASDYGIIFFAGGHATIFDFPTATEIHSIAADIYERGGVVAAVCHGPAVLGGLKLKDGQYLVNGKRATGFTVEEEDKVGLLNWLRKENLPLTPDLITAAGGKYEKGGAFKDFVIEDQRLVTGQNPVSATSTAEKAVQVYERRTA